jgi:hypothetical protein
MVFIQTCNLFAEFYSNSCVTVCNYNLLCTLFSPDTHHKFAVYHTLNKKRPKQFSICRFEEILRIVLERILKNILIQYCVLMKLIQNNCSLLFFSKSCISELRAKKYKVCDTCFLHDLMVEHKLSVHEKGVLRGSLLPTTDEERGGRRQLPNDYLHDTFPSPNTFRMISLVRITVAGRVERV